MLASFSLFLIIYFIYRSMAFNIAQSKWNNLISTYNDTQFYKLDEIAIDLITTAPANSKDDTYNMIASFTYQDGNISDFEATMLVELLELAGNQNSLAQRIDEIMENANTRKFKEISTEIIKLNPKDESIGYELARAIFNVEVGKTDIVQAYGTLKEYQENERFHNAVVKLKNVLDNDENIAIISKSEGISRPEIKKFLKNITTKEEKQ
ncbi:MAG TPA: hypothetical protein DCE48_14290 [Lachnospiraceae bacterium]|nr:hypothetical protein [Lachnospiraceae bacterium]